MKNVLSFNQKKHERDRLRKMEAEQILRQRRIFRGTVDDIATCTDPNQRRSLAEMLATLAFDAGWEAK